MFLFLHLESMQIWISKRDGVWFILPWNLQPLLCMNFCPPYSFTSIIAIPPRSKTLPKLAWHSSHVGGMVLCFLVVPGHFLWTKMFDGSFTINMIRWKKSIVMVPQAMGWSSRNSIGTSPTSYRRWNPGLHVKKTNHQHTFSYSENWIKRYDM